MLDPRMLTAPNGCDERFLADLVEDARRSLELRRVFLFGSRARGDARRRSDYDLAFEHDSNDATWSGFVTRAKEEALTLDNLDLIDLKSAPPELRERILEEGVQLYG